MTIDELDEYCRQAYETGYNKAIDDFANKMIETMNLGYMYTDKVIMDIAEQLKEGSK